MLTRSGVTRRERKVAAIVVAAMLAGIAACTTNPPQPVEINDNRASVRSMRIVWRPGNPEPMRMHGGVEIDYASQRGSGTQVLATGQRITLGDMTVYGPQTLLHEVKNRYVHLAYNGLIVTDFHASANDRIEVDFLIGMGQQTLTLRTQGSAPAAPELASNIIADGFVAGVAPRWRFGKYFAAEARYTHLTNLVDSRRSAELALTFRPVRQLVLRAGYNRTITSVGESQDYQSDVRATLSGPFLGVTLDF